MLRWIFHRLNQDIAYLYLKQVNNIKGIFYGCLRNYRNL